MPYRVVEVPCRVRAVRESKDQAFLPQLVDMAAKNDGALLPTAGSDARRENPTRSEQNEAPRDHGAEASGTSRRSSAPHSPGDPSEACLVLAAISGLPRERGKRSQRRLSCCLNSPGELI